MHCHSQVTSSVFYVIFVSIQGNASCYRQLQFLEKLLTVVPGCEKSAGSKMNAEMLLNELNAAENLPHLSQMLTPTLDPWPAHIKYECLSLFCFICMKSLPYVCISFKWMSNRRLIHSSLVNLHALWWFMLLASLFKSPHVGPLSNIPCFSSPHRALRKGTKSSPKPSREEAVDVGTLLKRTESALERLQTEVWCLCGVWCLR